MALKKAKKRSKGSLRKRRGQNLLAFCQDFVRRKEKAPKSRGDPGAMDRKKSYFPFFYFILREGEFREKYRRL